MAVTPSDASQLTSYIFTLGVECNDTTSALRRSLQTAAATCPQHPNRDARALRVSQCTECESYSNSHLELSVGAVWASAGRAVPGPPPREALVQEHCSNLSSSVYTHPNQRNLGVLGGRRLGLSRWATWPKWGIQSWLVAVGPLRAELLLPPKQHGKNAHALGMASLRSSTRKILQK